MLLEFAAATPSTGLLIAGWALVAGGWFGTWRGWRGPFPGETADRRDFLRSARQKAFMSAMALSAGMVALLIDRIWGKHGVARVGIDVFVALFFACGLGLLTVHFLSRPRWSIPPDLRPGAR